MNTTCLVACASRKKDGPRAAEQLYDSALFSGARDFAKSRCDDWYILSAKHGLTSPNTFLEPYDNSLLNTSSSFREAWAKNVFLQLQETGKKSGKIIFLAGKPNREYLAPMLNAQGIFTAAPMENLGIGRQVSWLQKVANEHIRVKDLDRLYQILGYLRDKVGGAPRMGTATAKLNWPNQGVYFFFEPNQFRMSSPFEGRVVRVGTHAVSEGSRTSLWNRLRTHRGGLDQSGNHRGSIFRLHVGNALARKYSVEEIFPTWGIGQSAPPNIRTAEQELEKLVSEYIGDMSILFLAVSGPSGPQSDRAYLERNLIALLCGAEGAIDLGTGDWLGHHSPRKEIADSGLWNLNYLGFSYDRRVLDILEEYVQITVGHSKDTGKTIAPRDWYKNSTNSKLGQISLL